MATTPRDRLEREKAKLPGYVDEGVLAPACRDALLEYADALDGATVRHKYRDAEGNVTEFKPRTIEDYLRSLRIASEHGATLLEMSAAEFNDLMDTLHDDHGKSKSALAGYQCAAAAFYRYHDLGVDPDDIHVYNSDTTPKHDEADMYTEAEVRSLRQACAESNNPVRNRALLELLIFTGQRLGALLTLRQRDVELEAPGEDDNSYIYLNDEYEAEHGGLKGALVRGRKRPMFGARKYVREWLAAHPRDGDDEWLFVGDPSHWKTDLDDHLARPSARQNLGRIAKRAGVDKPVNPHNFRHYCATVLYRDYDVDTDTIRMLFGHTETSSSLEETYSHLFDEDYIRKAEAALGFREDEQATTFTPDVCPTCGELLESHWRQCPACQEVFGPGEQFEERLETVAEEATGAAIESQDPERIAAYKAIMAAVDDPAALAEELAGLGGD